MRAEKLGVLVVVAMPPYMGAAGGPAGRMPAFMPADGKPIPEPNPLLMVPIVPTPPMGAAEGKPVEMAPVCTGPCRGPVLRDRLPSDVMLFIRLLVRSFA